MMREHRLSVIHWQYMGHKKGMCRASEHVFALAALCLYIGQ